MFMSVRKDIVELSLISLHPEREIQEEVEGRNGERYNFIIE
jgi:hypothetical protein